MHGMYVRYNVVVRRLRCVSAAHLIRFDTSASMWSTDGWTRTRIYGWMCGTVGTDHITVILHANVFIEFLILIDFYLKLTGCVRMCVWVDICGGWIRTTIFSILVGCARTRNIGL